MDEQLVVVLQQFQQHDNAVRKNAEEAFKSMAKQPSILPSLLSIVRNAPAADLRQLAAVLLRKKVAAHWAAQAEETKAAMRSTLLECIVGEPIPLVRMSDTHLVAMIAKHELPSASWPQLLPFLMQCCQSGQEDHREVALVLFSALVETAGESLRPLFPSLQAVFEAGLRDQSSSRVRSAAIKAVGSLVEYMESEQDVVLMRGLIIPMLDVARHSAASGQEEVVVRVCEIIDELIESPAPVLKPHLPAVIQLALELAGNPRLEPSTRFQAAQIVSWMAGWKPKTLVKANLLPPILAVFCPLLAEPCGETDSEEDESYELSAQRFSAQVLDSLAMSLPKKQLLPPILQFAAANASSADPQLRFAALMAVAVIVEGCCEPLRKKLGTVLPLFLQGLRDPSQKVRGTACFAVGQLAEFVQPEVGERFNELLPPLFAALEDADKKVQERAFYALAALCEGMGEEILPFLDPLMQRLLVGVQQGPRNLQEMCLTTIGCAAAAAEEKFAPYAEHVLRLLVPLVSLTQESDLSLRAKAYELAGTVARALGRGPVEAVLPGFMDAALKGFSLDSSELREYGHALFGDVAKTLGADFAPYLPFVVPLAIASSRLDDGIVLNDAPGSSSSTAAEGADGLPLAAAEGEQGSIRAALADLADDDDDDEDEDEDEEALKALRGISIRTGVLDEKAAAAQALGLYALHTKQHFAPYLEESLAVLKDNSSYSHEEVRVQSLMALQHLVFATVHAFPAASALAGPSQQTRHALESCMAVLLEVAAEDEDKEVAAQSFVCISGLINLAVEPKAEQQQRAGGSAAEEGQLDETQRAAVRGMMQGYVPKVCEVLQTALRELLPCQQKADEEGGEDDEDVEHDEVLIDSAMDLIPSIAALMGQQFQPLLDLLLPDILRFTKATRPPADRSMAVGCIAEVLSAIPHAVEAYVERLLPLLLRELAGEEEGNRRNAAFCVGRICELGGATALQHFNQVLLALHPLFSAQEVGEVRDNAVAAVARMISSNAQAMPLDQVLPIFVGALPLRSDLDEARVVYDCIASLLAASNQEAINSIPKLIPIFGEVLTQTGVSETVRQTVAMVVANLMRAYPDQLTGLVASLPEDRKMAIQVALHGRV